MRIVFAVAQPPLWLRLALEAANDDGIPFGTVVWSGFLWRNECLGGRLTGRKRRPCVVIGCRRRRGRRLDIALLPVSHARAEGRPHIPLRPGLAETSLLDNRTNRLFLTDGNIITVTRDGVNPAAYGGALTPNGRLVLRRALRQILSPRRGPPVRLSWVSAAVLAPTPPA